MDPAPRLPTSSASLSLSICVQIKAHDRQKKHENPWRSECLCYEIACERFRFVPISVTGVHLGAVPKRIDSNGVRLDQRDVVDEQAQDALALAGVDPRIIPDSG